MFEKIKTVCATRVVINKIMKNCSNDQTLDEIKEIFISYNNLSYFHDLWFSIDEKIKSYDKKT